MVIGLMYAAFKLTDIINYGHANINWWWIVLAILELGIEIYMLIYFSREPEAEPAHPLPVEEPKEQIPYVKPEILRHRPEQRADDFSWENPYVKGTVRYMDWEKRYGTD